MSRPLKKRNVAFNPKVTLFTPSGVPRCRMDTVILGTDEIEALRLTDLEGMYQGEAAETMGISRQTLGNILCSAHRKVSEALTQGKAIRIGAMSTPGNRSSHPESPGGCARKTGNGCQQDDEGDCGSKSGDGCGSGTGGDCGHGPDHGCRK